VCVVVVVGCYVMIAYEHVEEESKIVDDVCRIDQV